MKFGKIILSVFVLLIGISLVSASYWVNDPADCPSTDATNFPGQDCSPNNICGDSSGIAQCYDTSGLSAPSSSSTSSTQYSGAYSGGYILNCEATADSAEPYCDNSGNAWCNRDSSCYSVNRLTSCTSGSWEAFTCGTCRSGYNYCDGSYTDADGCEIQTSATAYPSEDNAVYDSSCDPTCSGNYLDCNSNLGSAVDGCEILDGGACTVGTLSGTYDGCSGSSGNCVVTQSDFRTGNETSYSTDNALLWGSQYGAGYLINMTNGSDLKFGVNNSGCVVFPDGTTQCTQATDTNLTNVAYYNQSNTFSENQTFSNNITVSDTGFFSWLGSLTSRITKLFVQDIDASGNLSVGGELNVSGNALLNNNVNITGDLHMGGAITHNSPVEIREGIALTNESYSHTFTIYNAHGEISNVSDAFANTLIFQSDKIDNPNSMEVCFWDKENQIMYFCVNEGGTQKATTFRRSLQIVGNLTKKENDENFTLCEGNNYVDCSTDTTGADLLVDDDIEAQSIYANENFFATGNVTASYFIGDGSQLTGISGGIWNNVSGVATYDGDVNVTGTSYLGDVTLTSDNITVNNILSKDGNISLNNSLYLAESGKIGIGTTNPGSKLEVSRGNIEVSNPYSTQLGSTSAGTVVSALAVFNDYAYIADNGDDELRIIDISDPTSPETISTLSISNAPLDLTTDGKYVYIVDSVNDQFRVIDVSNPANPITESTLSFGSGPRRIVISGMYAYTLHADGSLKITDISDITAPVEVGSITTGSTPNELVVYGRYVYLVGTSTNKFRIVDVSNPTDPTSVGTLTDGSAPTSVVVSGRYAYFTDSGTGQDNLRVVDVSNVTNPVSINTTSLGNIPHKVEIAGDYLYVIDQGSDDLKIFDISISPAAPTQVDSLSIGNSPVDIVASGKYLYVVDSFTDDLRIIDVSGISAPAAKIGSLGTGILDVSENAKISGSLFVDSGIISGESGILSYGPASFNNGSFKADAELVSIDGDLNVTGNITADYFIGNGSQLNTNSSTWWAGLTGWVSGWFVNTGNNLDFNETKLNETITSVSSIYNDTTKINSINSSLQTEITNRENNDTALESKIDSVNGSMLWTNESGVATYDGNVNVTGNLNIENNIDITNGSLYQPSSGEGHEYGLVLDIPFLEDGTGTQYDRGPYGNDGANTDVTVANGVGVFDGDSSYLDLGNDASLTQQFQNLSVEIFYKRDIAWSGSVTFVGRTYQVWEVYTYVDGESLRFYIADVQIASDIDLPYGDGKYHQIVVTFDDAADEVKFYLDGVLSDTVTGVTQAIPASSNGLYIGRRVGGTSYINSTLRSVKIYDRVLSEDELRTHYLRQGGDSVVKADKFRIVNTTGNVSFEADSSGAKVFGDLNVTGTSYLGDAIIDSDNITVNNILSRDGNLSLNNRLYLTEGENVGIGTSNPSAKLYIDQNSNDEALIIDSTSTTERAVDIQANSLTSGSAMRIYSGSSDASTRYLLEIFQQNSGASGTYPLYVHSNDQDGNLVQFLGGKITHNYQGTGGIAHAISSSNLETGVGFSVATNSLTTGKAVSVTGDGLTTGKLARFYSNSDNESDRNLFEIINDNAAATGATGLYIQQDSTGLALDVRGNINVSGNFTTVGNVGIGTSSPSELLHIYEESFPAYIKLESDYGFSSVHLDGNSTTNSIIGMVNFLNDGDSIATIGARRVDYDDQGELLFYTQKTGGSIEERLRIDADGNVGIGNSTPSTDLHLYRTSGTAELTLETTANADSAISIRSGGELRGAIGYDRSDGVLKLYSNAFDGGENGISVTNTGDVGIGTTSPNQAFSIKGDGVDIFQSFVDSSNNERQLLGYQGSATLDASSLNGLGASSFLMDTNGDLHVSSRANTASDVVFYTHNGSVLAESMRVTDDGNVGIGNSTPAKKLHVEGDGVYWNTGDHEITMTTPGGDTGLLFNENSFGDFSRFNLRNRDAASTADRYFSLGYNGVGETLVIDYEDKVGIGTVSPSATLEIASDETSSNSFALTASSLTTGYAAQIYSNSADTSTRRILSVVNDNAASSGTTALYVKQDSTGDIVNFVDDSTEVFTILDGGNVGIGEASPSSKLEVNGDVNLNDTLYVTSDGKVGLGMSDPDEKLEVGGGIKLSSSIYSYGGGRFFGLGVYYNGSNWVRYGSNAGIGMRNNGNGMQLFTIPSGDNGEAVTFNTNIYIDSNTSHVGIGSSTAPASTLDAPGVYSDTVGATNRDLYIDNTGIIGYVSSSERYKSNITNLSNTDWIYDLRPVSFVRDSDGIEDVGLIAEEVHKINPDLVSYDLFELVNGSHVKVDDREEYDGYVELDKTMTSEDVWEVTLGKNVSLEKVREIFNETTNQTIHETYTETEIDTTKKVIAKLPETVSYSKLIIPLLKAIQELRKDFDALVGGNYSVEHEAVFNEDMVGTATIKVNETFVEVEFGGGYGNVPVVTLTPMSSFVLFRTDNVTERGFKILINEAQDEEVKFSWHAFALEIEEENNTTLVEKNVTLNETICNVTFVNGTNVTVCVGANMTNTTGERNITSPSNLTLVENVTKEVNQIVGSEEFARETIEEEIEGELILEGNESIEEEINMTGAEESDKTSMEEESSESVEGANETAEAEVNESSSVSSEGGSGRTEGSLESETRVEESVVEETIEEEATMEGVERTNEESTSEESENFESLEEDNSGDLGFEGSSNSDSESSDGEGSESSSGSSSAESSEDSGAPLTGGVIGTNKNFKTLSKFVSWAKSYFN